MRALDLDPGMDTTYRLSEISFHIGRIRAVQMMKSCMQSGRQLMPKFVSFCLVEAFNLGYVCQHPTPSVEVLEKELRRF